MLTKNIKSLNLLIVKVLQIKVGNKFLKHSLGAILFSEAFLKFAYIESKM